MENLSLLDGAPPTQTNWKYSLVVRVFAARGLGGEESKRKRMVAIRLLFGKDHVEETQFVEIVNGKAKWNQTFVFPCSSRLEESILEVSSLRISSILHRHKVKAKAYISCSSFPDEERALEEGWFSLNPKEEEVKLSIFWRKVRLEEGEELEEQLPRLAQSNNSTTWKWPLRAGNSSGANNSPTTKRETSEVSFKSVTDLVEKKKLHVLTASNLKPDNSTFALHTSMNRAHLTVKVFQARNLLAVNRFTLASVSDPFVLVCCRGTQKESDYVKKTLNPTWQKNTFEFGTLEDLDVSQDEVRIVVKDWDRLGKFKDLGEVVISLKQIAHLPSTPFWIPLNPTIYMTDKEREHDLGEIFVSLTLVNAAEDEKSVVVAPSLGTIPPLLLSDKSLRFPITIAATTTTTTSDRPRLYVHLIQARNLIASDFGGVSDPYCVLEVKHRTKRTSTISKTLCPLWDFECEFGQDDYISLNDELKITLFDRDSVISDLVDDKLGQIKIPMWSLLPTEAQSPTWYSIEPSTSVQKCTGEIQLALKYSNPLLESKVKDIFNGKVWLLELQVNVLEAKNLPLHCKQPHCQIALLASSTDSSSGKRFRTKAAQSAAHPSWASERFKFRGNAHASSSQREGVLKSDVLRITIGDKHNKNYGTVSMDVAHMMDRLGYFDAQGGTFTSWVDVDANPTHGEQEEEEEDMLLMEDGESERDGESVMTFLSPTRHSWRLRNFMSSTTTTTSSVQEEIQQELPTTKLPPVALRLKIRLLPIGETRTRVNKKLLIRVEDLTCTHVFSKELPLLVYLRCRIGSNVRESPNVLFHGNVLGGNPRFHTNFYFQDEVDWLLEESLRVIQAEEVRMRRRQRGVVTTTTTPSSHSAADRIVFSLFNGETDEALGEWCTSFSVLGLTPASPLNSITFKELVDVDDARKLNVKFTLVAVKEELVPLLGHVQLRLLRFKTVNLSFDLHATLKFVVKYGDKIFLSKTFEGDPCPILCTRNREEDLIRFPIYNMFAKITIEVWISSRKGGFRKPDLSAPAPLAALMEKIRSVRGDVRTTTTSSNNGACEEIEHTKFGTLLGSCSLSLFDLYEIEARTVFEEDRGSAPVLEKAFKMPLTLQSTTTTPTGKVRGTLYLEAKCTENGGFAGILAANPHPPLAPERNFSLANIRHETIRLTKILAWFSSFSNHVQALMNWDNPTRTASALVSIVVLCCADWFAGHWLLVFPLCLLIHMINRHKQRMNGQFESEFDVVMDKSSAAAAMSAHCRVACVSVQDRDTSMSSCFVKVSVLDTPKSVPILIGQTKTAPLVQSVANLTMDKLGYSVKSSNRQYRTLLHMWKYKDTEPVIPSFDFSIENKGIMAEQCLCVIHVLRGRNLLAKDANGKSDPFARLVVRDGLGGEEKQRTPTQFATLNPEWHSKFVFGNADKPLGSAGHFELLMFDQDKTRDEPMGSLSLSLSQIDVLFPPAQPQMSVLDRAKWFPLTLPGGIMCGEVLLFMEWFEIGSVFKRQGRHDHSSLVGGEGGEQGRGDHNLDIYDNNNNDEEEEELPVNSWTRCGGLVQFQVCNRQNQVLGNCQLVLGSLVESDSFRVQPLVDLFLPLVDGIAHSAVLHIRVQLTLPDPKAEETRMAMEEAKRADTLHPGKKYKLMMNSLSKVQAELAKVNTQGERVKNLFNWTHPRRTKLMFNLQIFLLLLFIFIPSRLFVLLMVLFFFTEKFRPMGTMGLRFKHLLSQLPTDDDLRVVIQGPAYSSKRKVMSLMHTRRDEALPTVTLQQQQPSSDLPSLPLLKRQTSTFLPRSVLFKTENINSLTPADGLYSGSLSFLKLKLPGASQQQPQQPVAQYFERRFFILSSLGFHAWTDRETAFSGSHLPSLHVLRVTGVQDFASLTNRNALVTLSAQFQREDCMFVVDGQEGRFLFLASTVGKKMNWIEAAKSILLSQRMESSNNNL